MALDRKYLVITEGGAERDARNEVVINKLVRNCRGVEVALILYVVLFEFFQFFSTTFPIFIERITRPERKKVLI